MNRNSKAIKYDTYKYINIVYEYKNKMLVKSKCLLPARHLTLFYFNLEAVRLPSGLRRDK